MIIQCIRIINNIIKNAPTTSVGQSHGGNVSIDAINMMVEINVLTINTPVRPDHQLSEKAQSMTILRYTMKKTQCKATEARVCFHAV